MTIGFFTLLVGFIALLVGVAYFLRWLAQVGWPAYLAQQERNVTSREAEGEKTRRHIADLMAGRDAAAASAITDAHSKIGAKVDEVHQDVRDLHTKHDKLDTVLRTLAIKVGASLFLLLCGSFVLGYGTARAKQPVLLAASCAGIGGCKAPEFCCATDTCCRNAGGTTAALTASTSATTPALLPHPNPAPQPIPPPQKPEPKEPKESRAVAPQSYYVAIDYGDDPFAAAQAARL